ncbi:nuclear transport factor 2 family protein [Massilia scottii]|uniref:nuclear transport factor 2 family protein n=1 Tax=Massilia scottii TaxID=3057166 RepID=UPI002796D8C5|nr:nuclear transport factor 2 family protein [Massilia sp. CCM 9029]MDQ1829573.1 ester cyclase [Massilia sp. CCM 9029]
MNKAFISLVAACAFALPLQASAQDPVQATADHAQLLSSPDPQLAANKRLVYDFWREVLEGGHLELADKYLVDSYIQHNPTVPSGREGFVKFFSKFSKVKPIAASIKAPLVTIMAEGDLVMLGFVREYPDPAAAGQKYTTTWFDMFRIREGKIVEHWDPARK